MPQIKSSTKLKNNFMKNKFQVSKCNWDHMKKKYNNWLNKGKNGYGVKIVMKFFKDNIKFLTKRIWDSKNLA